jgi:CBS domain-containing protein
MGTATQLLARKDSAVWSVTPDTSVYSAIELMAEKQIGALLVTRGNEIAGIVSERDYARKVILQGKESRKSRVSEIMTPNVITARPSDTVDHCMTIMTKERIRHLPVMDGRRVVGMLSLGDLVAAKIAEQQATIEQLETYITS